MPDNHRRAAEAVEDLSTTIFLTQMSAVLASREKAYERILAALVDTEKRTLQKLITVFEKMSAAGINSMSPTGACDIIRSLQKRVELARNATAIYESESDFNTDTKRPSI